MLNCKCCEVVLLKVKTRVLYYFSVSCVLLSSRVLRSRDTSNPTAATFLRLRGNALSHDFVQRRIRFSCILDLSFPLFFYNFAKYLNSSYPLIVAYIC